MHRDVIPEENNMNDPSAFNQPNHGIISEFPPQNGTVCQNIHEQTVLQPNPVCGFNDLSWPNFGVNRQVSGDCTRYENGQAVKQSSQILDNKWTGKCSNFP